MSARGDIKRPMFINRGDDYLMNLAGVLLVAGDALYGDPQDTSPEGRDNAARMIDDIVNAAVQHGFPRATELKLSLLKNQPCERLCELAREATARIPNDVQRRIIHGFGLLKRS